MPDIEDILEQHDDELEDLSDRFSKSLQALLFLAQARAIADISSRLSAPTGVIKLTPGNRSVVRGLDNVLDTELADLGLEQLINAFVAKFGDQLGWLRKVLEATLPPDQLHSIMLTAISKADQQLFSMLQQDAATGLEELISRATDAARQKAVTSLGAIGPADLATLISTSLGKTVAQARVLAVTSISTFYRTVANLSYERLEQDKNFTIRYKYMGPDDDVTRPFCRRMLAEVAAGKTWSREEINTLQNAEGTPVWLYCGGTNCRHQFLVAGQEAR